MILVTGAAGLVGAELVKQLLASGKFVRAIYNRTVLSFEAHPNLEQVQCNILDVVALENAMIGVQQVFHCAAIVSFDPSDKARMFKTNIEGTANIVNAALEAAVSKLVFVSSVAALGRLRKNEAINETMNWTPETSNSAYGQSKYLAELEVWRGVAEGLDAVAVNPTIILGDSDWDDGSSKIFQSVYKEFPWYTNGTTGFVYVADVAKAMRMLMDSSLVGERYIVSAANKTYGEVFALIADSFGKKRPSKLVNPFIAALAWRMAWLKSKITGEKPLLTKETTTTALAKVTFDNSKLLQALPQFKYTPVEEAVPLVVQSLKKRYQL